MAKKKARGMSKKIKDKWRSKRWYSVMAPPIFKGVGIGETLSDDPEKVIGRMMDVALSDLTGDMSKSHIKLHFKIKDIDGDRAYTEYLGHEISRDYTRRLIRRKRAKISLIEDVATRDGRIVRLKILAIANRSIQSSQKSAIRALMTEKTRETASKNSFGDLVRQIVDGSLATILYKHCRTIYPLRVVEVHKSEVLGSFEGYEGETEAEEGGEEVKVEGLESDKEAAIKVLTTIPGVGPSKAEALYEAGIRSIEALRAIPVDELGKVDKIGPNMAHKIKEHLKTTK